MEVYWLHEREWYTATVTDTQTTNHVVRKARTPCREVRVVYDADAHELWHSVHNTKIRALAAPEPDIEGEDDETTTDEPPGAFAAHLSARNPSSLCAAWHQCTCMC